MNHTYREKARALVRRMTLSEKASLCSGADAWHTKAIDRLGIPAISMADGPHGLRKVAAGNNEKSAPATCFPTASALASTWDVDLIEEVGAALGREAAALDVQILLGPGVNMKRSPLGGRNFEYFSEDPVLAGQCAAAFVKGVQGQGVGACLKHFAANNQEHERMSNSSELNERTLFEIYLPAFEAAVEEAAPWTVMCAYNRINGVYASEHRGLLTEILRERFGFDGCVISDWGAVHDRVAGIEAGLDLEMPGNGGINDRRIVAAVDAGALDMTALDARVTDLLAVILKAQDAGRRGAPPDVDAHHALARRVCGEAMVLLKNSAGLLPIDPAQTPRIALIGAFAKSPRYQGAGSSQVNPTRLTNVFDEMAALLDPGAALSHAEGYRLDGADGDALIREAVATAREADVAVVFAGLPDSYESEGFDRATLSLPEEQLRLIDAVSDVQPHTAVVLMNGAAVAMPFADKPAVEAIVEAWLGGQASGGALADVLLGRVNPSGKLSETFPRRIEDTPTALEFPGQGGRAHYGEGLFIGYRYYDRKQIAPCFPFGFGLSYTSFEYTGISVSSDVIRDSETVAVSVTVKNTGSRDGKEVVQLYVRDTTGAVNRPDKELKRFAKVAIAPGEEARVSFSLGFRDFAHYNPDRRDWCVATGTYEILVGGASTALPLRRAVHVTATDPFHPRLGRETLLKAFENHPEGHAVYTAVIDRVLAQFDVGLQGMGAIERVSREKARRMEAAVVRDLPFYKLATLFSHLFSEQEVARLLARASVADTAPAPHPCESEQ